jgi:hypothetical protein
VTTTHFKIFGTIFKILNVIGRHLIFINILLEIEQGSYALLVKGVKSLPFLNSKDEIPPTPNTL